MRESGQSSSSRASLRTRLHRVVADVFSVDPHGLSDADSPQTIPAWDSVGHLRLVISLEAEFEVEFDPDEVGELITIGTLRRRLEQLRDGRGHD